MMINVGGVTCAKHFPWSMPSLWKPTMATLLFIFLLNFVHLLVAFHTQVMKKISYFPKYG